MQSLTLSIPLHLVDPAKVLKWLLQRKFPFKDVWQSCFKKLIM